MLPFIFGIAAGAGAVVAVNNRKEIKEKVAEGAGKAKEIAAEGAEKVKDAASDLKESVSKKYNEYTSENRDDLTKIKGIGKAFQEHLYSEKIYTYDAVANMSEKQITLMEEKYSFKGDFKESITDAKELTDGKK